MDRAGASSDAAASSGVTIRLPARAPFAGAEIFAFLHGRAIPGVEDVGDASYRRLARIGAREGIVLASLDPESPGIVLRIGAPLAEEADAVAARIRALFDLDARPDRVDPHLARDASLAPHVARTPGIRVPGAFDPWELATRAVLGQQVSVRGATTVSGRLVRAFGEQAAPDDGAAGWRFPPAEALARASADDVRRIGIPGARAAAIVALARAVAEGAVDLSPGADLERAVAALDAIRGIGPWTAGYVAMRALRAADAFLPDDLAAKKALAVTRAKDAARLSERWRPFRAYALMHLWRSLAPSSDAGG